MKRRGFLGALAGATAGLIALPELLRAQQPDPFKAKPMDFTDVQRKPKIATPSASDIINLADRRIQ